jgi:hypothetical protein
MTSSKTETEFKRNINWDILDFTINMSSMNTPSFSLGVFANFCPLSRLFRPQ